MTCRHCAEPLQHTFLDLGFAPPSNAYLSEADLGRAERYYPLKLKVCTACWLVQTADHTRATELFGEDYAYFSSVSTSWVQHAARYTEAIIQRLRLNGNSLVIEVASNDGYLLKNFLAAKIPCLGIEPTAGTADAAAKLGIFVIREFFGEALGQRLADEGKRADLIIGNNVYAHVPDINDFTRGLKTALKPGGTITLEFPHLLRLIEKMQFDTVYHEHFSYFSLYTVKRVFESNGLRVTSVDELRTHGGSLRVYGCHAADRRSENESVQAVLAAEQRAGLQELPVYLGFQKSADGVKDGLVAFLIEQKRAGRRLAAYGAAAKGNTVLNYAGIKPDLVPYICDAAPSKQGKFMPGSHIPIVAPSVLRELRPELVLILPWNIADEVMQEHSYLDEWGGRFVTAVPKVRIL